MTFNELHCLNGFHFGHLKNKLPVLHMAITDLWFSLERWFTAHHFREKILYLASKYGQCFTTGKLCSFLVI